MAEPVAPEIEEDVTEIDAESELGIDPAFDPDKEFSGLVYQLDEERKTLERGAIPRFQTPQDLVVNRAESLGKSPSQYQNELLESGFDVQDAIRVVGKGEARGLGEAVFGLDTEKYLSDVRGNRDKIKSFLHQERSRTTAAQKGREAVVEALKKQKAEGVSLPIEARSSE